MELRLPKIPEDSDFTPMLHLGRVMVFGELVPPPFSLLLSPEDNAKYNEILKIKQRTTRVQVCNQCKSIILTIVVKNRRRKV